MAAHDAEHRQTAVLEPRTVSSRIPAVVRLSSERTTAAEIGRFRLIVLVVPSLKDYETGFDADLVHRAGIDRRPGGRDFYALKQATASRLGDFWSLAHSQLYAEPERLLHGGYLTAERERHGRRRQLYALTDLGREALDGWLADPMTERYELRDPGLLKLALGAPVTALAAAQLELHRHALERYEKRAAAITPADAGDPQVLVLQAGIGHEREYVRFWASLLEGDGTIDRSVDVGSRSPATTVEDQDLLEVS